MPATNAAPAPRPPGRVEEILEATGEELEARRLQIDGRTGLKQLSLLYRFTEDGHLLGVSYREESFTLNPRLPPRRPRANAGREE